MSIHPEKADSNERADPTATGPWGLNDLETVLGKAKNGGRLYGPFPFTCGCIAEKAGLNGDLYLSACGAQHRSLKPTWTAVAGAPSNKIARRI